MVDSILKATVHFKRVNFMVCKLYKKKKTHKLKLSVTDNQILSEKLGKSPFVGTKM